MKTLGVVFFVLASIYGVFQLPSLRNDDFIRIEPALQQPVALPTKEKLPEVVQPPDQRSALEAVDPGSVDRALTLQMAFRQNR